MFALRGMALAIIALISRCNPSSGQNGMHADRASSSSVRLTPGDLAVEYQPYVRQYVDHPRPRFSWKLTGTGQVAARGASQAAYRIRVWQVSSGSVQGGLGSSRLTAVWDSGRVPGNKTSQVEYGGAIALVSDAEYAYSVSAWTVGHGEVRPVQPCQDAVFVLHPRQRRQRI